MEEKKEERTYKTRPPKHNYDGEEFYQDIYAYAMQGMVDAEIADMLDLDADTFNAMKKGSYIGWNDEQNERRSSKILVVLQRGRNKINAAVRGKYLKTALGGMKTTDVTTVRRKMYIGGEYTNEDEITTTTTERELAPNMQALSTWLYHHDKEWRENQQMSKIDITTNGKDVNGNVFRVLTKDEIKDFSKDFDEEY